MTALRSRAVIVSGSVLLVVLGATAFATSAVAADPDPRINYDVVDHLTSAELDTVSDLTLTATDLTMPVEDIVLPPPVDVATTTTKGTDTVVLLSSDILFEFDSATLNAAATARIGELVKPVPQGAKVRVYGFTDSVGDDAYNLDLSTQRAQAVAAAVTAARPDLVLDVQGKGEADPVQPNQKGSDDNPEGRAANRRVELRFQS